jgi:creatinine amidohydrolase
MTVRLEELTREQIRAMAPNAIAVLPTASIEQHGPHLPVVTDTLLCGTVALKSAERAVEVSGGKTQVLVAPVLPYCNSHHHRPFPGVLSLASPTYIAAVTDILEGLALSGFRKLMILNGHGGNTDSNAVAGLDFVNRLGHDVAIATAAYWDIARPSIVEAGIMDGGRVPGHAGRFETAMVMAIRPDLVNQEGLGQTQDQSKKNQGLFSKALVGGTVQVHGAWAASTGYSDYPAEATAEEGKAMLEIVVKTVADFMVAFDQTTK